MSAPSIANVRWGGNIINCPNGIDYEGGFSANFHVGMIRTFDELLLAIRDTIQLSDNGIICSVQFRQPFFCQDGIYYTITPVSNDYQFFLIVEHCRSIGMLEVLQFYAEVQEQQHEADYDENESDSSDQIPEYQEDESSEDDDDDEYWHEGDGDDDDDDDDVNDDHEMFYENPVLPLVHPAPYSEIDFNLMEIDTYSKPGGRTNFDPSKEFAIGMIFPSRDAVATAAVEYSMHRHVQFRSKQTKKEIYEIQCVKQSDECRWRLRAIPKKKSQMWTITKYSGPHSCRNIQSSQDHRQLNQKFISQFIESMVAVQSDIKVRTLQEEIKDKIGYQPSYRKTWKGKQMAIERIFGGWEDSYAQLSRFLTTMSVKNFGSPFLIEDSDAFVNQQYEPNYKYFDRCFWTFNQLVEGFKYCRPVIFVDGTFLYGKYRGCLLVATSLDGNNQIFPVAFAVVEKEDVDNWQWFMTLLRVYVSDRVGLCVISDRHIGVIKAMQTSDWQEPNGYHRFCIRHVVSNFNKKFKNSGLKKDVHCCAYEFQQRKFNHLMSRLRSISPEAGVYLDQIPVEKWTRCFDGGYRYGSMTTNAVESVNGMLKGFRSLPITAMVNNIFHQCAHYFDTRRTTLLQQKQNGFRFTQWVGELVQKNTIKANAHRVEVFDRLKMICEVKTPPNRATASGGRTQTVNLDARTCTCQKFQDLRIPCSHAIAAAIRLNVNYEAYVDNFYTLDSTLKSYRHMFVPLGDEGYWENIEGVRLAPDPARIRKKGRPKSSRIRNEMDWSRAIGSSSSRIHCSNCGNSGHNRSTCTHR